MTKKIDAELTPAEAENQRKLQKTWAAARGLKVGMQVQFTGYCTAEPDFEDRLKGVEGIIVEVGYNDKMGYDCVVAIPKAAWENATCMLAAELGEDHGQFVYQEANFVKELAEVK